MITHVNVNTFFFFFFFFFFVCFLTLSLPNFRRHLSSDSFIDKLSRDKKFICKDERLNIKQRRYR